VTKELTEADLENVHPIPGALVLLIEERGWADVTFDEEVLGELRVALQKIYQHEELRSAVRGLLNLAAFLMERGSKPGGQQLVALVDEQPVLDALDRLNAIRHDEKSEEVARTSKAFGDFSGQDTEKKAPKVGEKKPDDALSLDQLKFPKRL